MFVLRLAFKLFCDLWKEGPDLLHTQEHYGNGLPSEKKVEPRKP